MSEVMTCSTVDEKFSFSKSKCEQIQTEKETDLLARSDIEDESTLSFNDKLDIPSIKSSENTICGSDDSAVSHSISSKHLNNVADDIQDSANSTIRSDTSCEDYEYMTTENTMIDTNCSNSQPSVHDMNESKNSHCQSSLSTQNDVDSKRVVVQILSSDTKDSAKSVNLFENKSTSENQTNNCFRDDVCKLLTSSRHSMDYGSDTLEEKDLRETMNVSHNSLKKISSLIFSKNVRNQRRSSINPFLLYNKGPKFYDTKHVSKHLKAAKASALRAIHYILYDKYGLCGNEKQLALTRRRILRFSGYPFDKNTSKYQKKLKSLLKMPIQMLIDVHQAIFGKTPALEQVQMANNLMTVFSDTERYDEIISYLKQNIRYIPEHEYTALMEKAVLGPPPLVMVKRLTSEEVNHALSIRDPDRKPRARKESAESKLLKIKEKAAKMNENEDEPAYDLPAYILKGPGRKLKHFRCIVENVKKASEKELNLLHRLLYGREELIDVCRRNILEFSGFLECQHEFIFNVHQTLMRLDGSEILKLCKILCLRATTNSRKRKIIKVMQYLKKPFDPRKIKVPNFRQKIFPKNPVQSTFPASIHSTFESRVPVHPLKMWDEPEKAESDDGGYRLRDFRKICSNIECSAPSDLTELNDLLFLRPADETEIHDKILNFTRFGFSESSIHYHYRKTLMFYMGPCIVRKIARMLDIENWNLILSHEDLSGCILKFLMERKVPDLFNVNPNVLSSYPMSSLQNPTDQPGFRSQNFPPHLTQQSNQTTAFHQENVGVNASERTVLADLGSASDNECSFNESHNRNDRMVPGAINEEDDFVPLRDFIHHPTDAELKNVIEAIVKEGLFSITLGDVVKKIYHTFPSYNLTYREQFIKSETRKVVREMRQNAFEKVKQNSVT